MADRHGSQWQSGVKQRHLRFIIKDNRGDDASYGRGDGEYGSTLDVGDVGALLMQFCWPLGFGDGMM